MRGQEKNGPAKPNEPPVDEIPPECFVDLDCANNNICTTKTCIDYSCHTVPKADGSSCGFAQECINVVCTQMSIIPTLPEVDTTTQIAVVATAGIIVGAAYIYLHFLM